MAHNGRREASDIHPTNVRPVAEPKNEPEYLTLTPDWPNLLRWHLNAMATNSFDGHNGRLKALYSIMDITRYLAHTEPAELRQIMAEIGGASHD